MHDRNDPEVEPASDAISKRRIAIRQSVDESNVGCLVYVRDSQ